MQPFAPLMNRRGGGRRTWVTAVSLMTAVVAASWSGAAPDPGAAPDAAEPFELSDGVIVDPDRSAVYLMRPEGGLEAVQIASGESIWHSARISRPILLSGSLLVGQAENPGGAGTLRIVGLDVDDKAALRFESGIDLPAGVSARIDDGPRTSFQISVRPEAADLIVTWSHSLAPAQRGEAPVVRRETFRIDPRTSQVEKLSFEQVPKPPPPALPAAAADALEAGSLLRPPWRAGTSFVAPAPTPEGKGVVLRRWDAASGRPLPEIPLFGDKYQLRYASADGQHLLASRLDDRTRPDRYEWAIFSARTGKRVATLRGHATAAPFFLFSSLLIEVAAGQRTRSGAEWTEEPRRLRARDSATGAERWSRVLRDTKYRIR